MYELRQPSTPFGVANETLDDKVIINENRQEADCHRYGIKQKIHSAHSLASSVRVRLLIFKTLVHTS